MLYLVHMRVDLPANMPAAEVDAIKSREKAYAQSLQHRGVSAFMARSWRVRELQRLRRGLKRGVAELLVGLPLFLYLRFESRLSGTIPRLSGEDR